MSEKFPYGYDLNAYIDKAFEQMKADFPWATRDMIAEHTYYGIEKVGDDYQYVRYYSYCSPDILNVDCEEFIRRLTKDHDWELEEANPVKECIDVEASNRCSGDWFLECYQIQKHEKGGYSVYVTAGNRSAGGSKTSISTWLPPALSTWAGPILSETLALKSFLASEIYFQPVSEGQVPDIISYSELIYSVMSFFA